MSTCAICFEKISKAGTLQCGMCRVRWSELELIYASHHPGVMNDLIGHVMDLECLRAALRSQPRRCPVCRAPDDRPPIELFNNSDEPASSGSNKRKAPSSSRSPPPSPSRSPTAISFSEISINVLTTDIIELQNVNSLLVRELDTARRFAEEARSDRQGIHNFVLEEFITNPTSLAYELEVKKLRKQNKTLEREAASEKSRAEAQLLQAHELTLRVGHLEAEIKRKQAKSKDIEEELDNLQRSDQLYRSRLSKVLALFCNIYIPTDRIFPCIAREAARERPRRLRAPSRCR